MPLTFLSHQAVVLPLKMAAPRWTSGTALVLGSIAPDVEYFARTYPGVSVSHSWPGLFSFCLPVTLALYWLVTRVIVVPLVAHLPDAGPLRLHEYVLLRSQPSTLRHWSIVAVSALIGAASHVLLDRLSGGWSMHAATVYGAWFPFSAMRSDWHWIAFKLLTWILLAMATLVMMRRIGTRRLLRRWVAERGGDGRRIDPHASPGSGSPGPSEDLAVTRDAFWAIILLGALLAGVLGAIFRRSAYFMHQPATWVHIGLAAISGAFVGLVVASIVWHRRFSHLIVARGTSQ